MPASEPERQRRVEEYVRGILDRAFECSPGGLVQTVADEDFWTIVAEAPR